MDNTNTAVLVRIENGTLAVRLNQIFSLFDDDDFNSNDGTMFRGDDGEDVDKLYDTLSHLQSSSDVNANPFAAAYIEPEYLWAQSAGFNDSNVAFELNYPDSYDNGADVRIKIEPYRGSKNSELDDFWVGYILVAYQSSVISSNDPSYIPVLDSANGFGVTAGIAPTINDANTDLKDGTIDSRGVPRGSIGAVVYIETMRDLDMGPNMFPNGLPFQSRIQTPPHELGHQFGVMGHAPNFGVMSNIGTSNLLQFIEPHINLMRWRIHSPGEGGQ